MGVPAMRTVERALKALLRRLHSRLVGRARYFVRGDTQDLSPRYPPNRDGERYSIGG